MEDLAVNSQSNGFHVQEMPSLIVFMEAADDVDQKEVKIAVRCTNGKEETGPSRICFGLRLAMTLLERRRGEMLWSAFFSKYVGR